MDPPKSNKVYSSLLPSPPDEDNQTIDEEWIPGIRRRLPWIALLAAVGVVIAIVSTLVVLVNSHGKPIDSWPDHRRPIQPTVLVAVFTAIANTLLRYLLAEGVQLSWWTKALDGATVGDLHRYWSFGSSAFAAALAGRHFNWISLASLITTLVVVDGPLLQRSSTVAVQSYAAPVNISAQHPTAPLPLGFTGISAQNGRAYVFSPPFLGVVQQYYKNSEIPMSYSGCNGTCIATLPGAGFDYQCTTTEHPLTVHYNNISTMMWSNTTYNAAYGSGVLGFATGFPSGSSNTTFESDPDAGYVCKRSQTVVNCTLRYAKVNYPVTLMNGTARLDRFTLGSNETLELYPDFNEFYGIENEPSTMGGMATAAKSLFTSSANYSNPLGTVVDGMLASLYMTKPNSHEQSCDIEYSDPTPDVLNAVREIMFRTAIAASNSSTVKTVVAHQKGNRTIYVSDYQWFGGALALMLLNVLVTIPLFVGWWHHGRMVSLSPIEISKAFEAPLLEGSSTNSNIDALLDQVGTRGVQYGEDSRGDSSRRRLRMGPPLETTKPMAGTPY